MAYTNRYTATDSKNNPIILPRKLEVYQIGLENPIIMLKHVPVNNSNFPITIKKQVNLYTPDDKVLNFVQTTTTISAENQFLIPVYEDKVVQFHESQKGKWITVSYGTSARDLYSMEDILYEGNIGTGAIKTLQDYMNQMKNVRENYKELDSGLKIIKQFRQDIESAGDILMDLEKAKELRAYYETTLPILESKMNELNLWLQYNANIVEINDRLTHLEETINQLMPTNLLTEEEQNNG